MKRCISILVVLTAAAIAQQATAPELSFQTTQLPRAIAGRAYGERIETAGGAPPRSLKLVAGTLPAGLDLDPSGWITGIARKIGTYEFTVELSDAAQPPHVLRHAYTLAVVRPLAVEWKPAPEIRGGGIYGSVEVSNTSQTTADVTVIIVAVNEYGKAFALGYNRGPMQAGAAPETVEFGSTLPAGTYSVRVDAVGEVARTGEIWRAALTAPKPLTLTITP